MIALLFAFCCTRPVDDLSVYELGPAETELSVGYEGGECSTRVLSNGDFTVTLPEDAQSRNERVVGEALLATETKNEFYQYFRRTMGVQEGGNLYKAVRGEYDRLQKALAETL